MIGIIGVVFFFLGILLIVIAGIWGTVLAFQENVVWGLLYLLVPFAALVFVVKKWSKKAVRNSFFLGILGLISMTSGFVISSFRLNSLAERQEQAPIGSGDQPFPIDDSDAEQSAETPAADSADPTVQSGESNSPADPAPPETTTDSQTAEATSADDYHNTMMLGYEAYGEGNYQTALTNFEQALEMKPGDQLAIEAIANTESAIAAN